MSNRAVATALYALLLILPLSAMLAQWVPLGTAVRAILGLAAIFALGIVLVPPDELSRRAAVVARGRTNSDPQV